MEGEMNKLQSKQSVRHFIVLFVFIGLFSFPTLPSYALTMSTNAEIYINSTTIAGFPISAVDPQTGN